MNKRTFKTVQNAVVRASTTVPLNTTWEGIHASLGIGEVTGTQLRLSAADRQTLQAWIEHNTGLDTAHTTKVPTDRMEAAEHGHNEKWTGTAVFGGQIRVVRHGGGQIPLINGLSAELPACPELYLSVPASQVDWSTETVVIVENGSALLHGHALRLPPELTGALLVYRGHGLDAQALIEQLKQRPPARVVGFYDFDPAGLNLALQSSCEAIVVPTAEALQDHLWLARHNQRDLWWQQTAQWEQIQQNAPTEWAELVALMGSLKLAVMQEHMIRHRLGLRMVHHRSTQ